MYGCPLEPVQQVLTSVLGYVFLGKKSFFLRSCFLLSTKRLQKTIPVPSGVASESRRQVGTGFGGWALDSTGTPGIFGEGLLVFMGAVERGSLNSAAARGCT